MNILILSLCHFSHILATVVWIGGIVMILLVILPGAKAVLESPMQSRLLKILVQLPLTSWMRSSTPASSFFNWSLYSSSLSCSSFADMKRRKNVPHPHPQQPQVHPQAPRVDWVPLARHISITSFLLVVVYMFSLLTERLNIKILIKYFSNCLNIKV